MLKALIDCFVNPTKNEVKAAEKHNQKDENNKVGIVPDEEPQQSAFAFSVQIVEKPCSIPFRVKTTTNDKNSRRRSMYIYMQASSDSQLLLHEKFHDKLDDIVAKQFFPLFMVFLKEWKQELIIIAIKQQRFKENLQDFYFNKLLFC